MRHFIFFILPMLGLFSQETASPRQVAKELEEAQIQFLRAKQMFNPWYTGPLITPSPSLVSPGQVMVQPYLIFGGTYATFDKNRKSRALGGNLYSLDLLSVFQTGITDSVDFIIVPGAATNWQKGDSGGGFVDIPATIGFLIRSETLYGPAMKFSITETFPTGKYQNLSLNGLGLNATGGGAYQTQFGFATSKLLWWLYEHPINLRAFVGFTVATTVQVEGFNAYGGDKTTKGVVHPGDLLSTDLGIEYSLTKRWALAFDVVYTAENKTRFDGKTKSPVGGGYSDNLSFAPAIEYHFDSALGLLWGVQFSVYGRNSDNFAKGQFSVVCSW